MEYQQTVSRHTDGVAIRLVPPDAVDGRVSSGKTLAEMGGSPHQPNTLGRLEAWRKAKGISLSLAKANQIYLSKGCSKAQSLEHPFCV